MGASASKFASPQGPPPRGGSGIRSEKTVQVHEHHHTTNPDEAAIQRERNKRTIRIELVDNGFIITEIGNNVKAVYTDLGIDLDVDGPPTNVLEHVVGFGRRCREGGM